MEQMNEEVNQQQYDDNKGDLSCYQQNIKVIGDCVGCLRVWLPCFCFCFNYPYQVVHQKEEGVICQFGRYSCKKEPGLHYVNSLTETITKVPQTVQMVNLPRQVVMTMDNMSISIDAAAYFKISDSYKALFKINDYRNAVQYHCFSVLRDVVGDLRFHDILIDRQLFQNKINQLAQKNTEDWGLQVHTLQIQDIILQQHIADALCKPQIETKLAEAKIVNAKANIEAAGLLKQAADILDSRPAMQIRFLDSLCKLAKSSKIVFQQDQTFKQLFQ